jgi:serine/threonine protein kinase
MRKTPSHEKIDVGLREDSEDPVTVLSAQDPTTLLDEADQANLFEEKDPATVLSAEQPTISQNPSLEEKSAGGSFQIIADKYRILKKLGSGGISSVYRVQHVHLGKTYALKLLQELKQDSIMRFQQEAKAASMLHHSNIVGVVDFGIHNGTPYMVMDCVEGQTLSQFAKTNSAARDPVKLARLFGEICSALAHAHEAGVVHRDIKPSNIMITQDESLVEHAVVVDFGIAKITKGPESTDSQLTRTGDVFGTPLYMSPEQCRGAAVDARSDIYSLGCVMYELITGRPPFEGDSPYEIIHKQISVAPEPFSNQLRKSKTIQQLETLILRAMAKSPEDRFQYMLEMSSALKAIELGSKASQNMLPHQLKMAVARFKASDRQEAILHFGLVSSTILASILAVVITIFPAELNKTSHQIDFETKIIAQIRKIFTMKKERESSIFKIHKNTVKRDLIYLKNYCSVDKETAAKFEIVSVKTLKAATTLREVGRIRNSVANAATLMEITTNLNNMESTLSATIAAWSQADIEANELANITSIKLEAAKNKLIVMTLLLIASLVLALPVGIILCFLVYLSYNRKKKSAQEGSDPLEKLVLKQK